MASNYRGNRKSNFVKPAEQHVASGIDIKTLMHPNFKVAYVEIVDFGSLGVTLELVGKVGNMNARSQWGDAATRLDGADVAAYVKASGLPRTSTPEDEAWTTSSKTGNLYRVVTFGSKAVNHQGTGSAFDAEQPQSAF